MTRPDPRENLMGFLDWLGDQVEAVARARDEQRVNPTDAAQLLGFPKGYFSATRYPWRIPGFGAAGTLHPVSAWRAWIESGSDKGLRAKWEAIPPVERRKIQGRAA